MQVLKRKAKEKGKTFLGVVIIIAGIGIYLYPNIREWEMDWRTKKLIAEFEELYGVGLTEDDANPEENSEYDTGDDRAQEEPKYETGNGRTQEESESAAEQGTKNAELYKRMKEYNEDLAENGQELVDAWSYAQEPIDLEGMITEDGAVGYIQIPAMDVTLPLYIGASADNLSKGAAVLGETSMPIGGESTNCVIAGHRGYSGRPYFREIEKLQAGDAVYVTNPWETMTYIVEEICIVNPDEVESILIVSGRDQITLLTCHPYMSHGKYRYVVICGRADGAADEAGDVEAAELDEKTGNGGTGELVRKRAEELDADSSDSLSANGILKFLFAFFDLESISELQIIIEKALRFLLPAMAADLILANYLRNKPGKRRNHRR
ncbi:MAG: class C sortase [Lachnospiraceae bacterium]|nr:class C sortase [Lachnospiraceae bacterium]